MRKREKEKKVKRMAILFIAFEKRMPKGYKFPRRMKKSYCKKTPCKKMGFTQKASCRPYKNCYRTRKRVKV
jgi:hypothetical protein